MIIDEKTESMQGVFNISCPKCGVTSFIGFECTAEQLEGTTHGLLGFARRKEGLITQAIPDWVHCPACDETLNEMKGVDINDIITDVTKPKP
jgi:hypothetical protein